MKSHVPKPGDLKKLSQKDLDEVIKLHKDFVEGRRGGNRAILKFLDLSALDFLSADLSQADFTGSKLINADLSMGTFESSCFFACDLRNANLEGASFARADFRGASVAGANLTGADLNSADMREGKIMERGQNGILENRQRLGTNDSQSWRTIFTGAKLSDTIMSNVKASGADFSDADLTGVVMQDAELSNVNFKGANLTDADFTGSDLKQANMEAAVIIGTVLESTELEGVNMDRALSAESMGQNLAKSTGKSIQDLIVAHTQWVNSAGKTGQQLDLSGIDMREVLGLRRYPLTAIKAIAANFLGQDLREIEMQSAKLDRSDFRDCRMMQGDFRGCSMRKAVLARANLAGANLGPLKIETPDNKTRLIRCDLSGAELRFSNFRDANLQDCILMGADLSNAIFNGCDLRRADLTGAILDGADFRGALTDDIVK